MLRMQQDSQLFNKKDFIEQLMEEKTYIKRANHEVLEKLKKYIHYEPCTINDAPLDYVMMMKENFILEKRDLNESTKISCFKIKDNNRLLSSNDIDISNSIIMAEDNSQMIVSNNDIVQTIILILQGFSDEENLTEFEVENAYEEYIKHLSFALRLLP